MVAKTGKEKSILREGGRKLAVIMQEVAQAVHPGVSAKDLDSLAERLILSCGGRPSFKGYASKEGRVYPATLCVSVNDEVVHAIPSSKKILLLGDIVSLDLGMWYQDLSTDMAVTVVVGEADSKAKKLIKVTFEALEKGVHAALPGKTTGDIGYAIEKTARSSKFGVVKELGGHGVGQAVHEEPMIPNYGSPGEGEEIVEGMVLAVEPMFSLGSGEVKEMSDGWTWVTMDGSLAAHFEHTILVTEHGAEILTKT